MARERSVPLVVLPGNTMRWGGLILHRDTRTDYFTSRTAPFGWEVDASYDEDDEYEARVLFRGVKLVTSKGRTRQTALAKALRELNALGTQIGNEASARWEGPHDPQKSGDRSA